MSTHYLEFEKPLADLQTKIDGLKLSAKSDGSDISDEVARLEQKQQKLRSSIYASLTPWQVTQVARHPLRPYSADYIERMCDTFDELHGDRMFADDQAIIGGLARINNIPIMIIGHQKGRTTKDKVRRNFGMPRPEGYRKAQRLMKLAEKFAIPVVTLIDTPGAYPGIDAESRGQSEAIARSLFVMADLNVPIVSAVIGEGGSGGALAIGVCDRLIMLSNSVYSVISPEGCASILWKNPDKARDAAEAMGLTTDKLLKNDLVDEVVVEPTGGAQLDYDATAEALKEAIVSALEELMPLDTKTLIKQRHHRVRGYARFEE